MTPEQDEGLDRLALATAIEIYGPSPNEPGDCSSLGEARTIWRNQVSRARKIVRKTIDCMWRAAVDTFAEQLLRGATP